MRLLIIDFRLQEPGPAVIAHAAAADAHDVPRGVVIHTLLSHIMSYGDAQFRWTHLPDEVGEQLGLELLHHAGIQVLVEPLGPLRIRRSSVLGIPERQVPVFKTSSEVLDQLSVRIHLCSIGIGLGVTGSLLALLVRGGSIIRRLPVLRLLHRGYYLNLFNIQIILDRLIYP